MPDPTAKYVVLRDPKTNEILIPKTSAIDYEVVDSQPVPPYELNVDADTLQGHPATDFQLAGEGPDLNNYYTKNEVDAKLPGGNKPSSHTPGDSIWWDNKPWLVCHYDSINNQVYLIAKDVLTNAIFRDNMTLAASYQAGAMSSAALAQCVDVTVEGVTAKVFAPSYDQMNGGFSWFATQANRIAELAGTATIYWTSSTSSTAGRAWRVYTDGQLTEVIQSSKYGFRPCVCVQL